MVLLIFVLILYIGSESQAPLIYFVGFFFCIIEGKKLEDLAFLGLVHMRFLWFSSLSAVLKLRHP